MSNLDDERLMQPVKAPMRNLALRYGVIIALALFVVGLLLQFSGMVDPAAQKGTWISTVLTILVFFGGIYYAMGEYKKESGNLITFGRALGFGALTVLIASLIGLVLNWINFEFIDPGMIAKVREMQVAEMEKQGMDDEAIAQAQNYMGFIMNPVFFALVGAFVSYFFGFIGALISAAIHQNAKPAPNI